jgi:hypothetical protein
MEWPVGFIHSGHVGLPVRINIACMDFLSIL